MAITGNIIDQCPGNLDGIAQSLFLILINSLFTAKCGLKTPEVKDYAPNLSELISFDFIVVGAGTAGPVVASRLSEIKEWNVLLVEAGNDASVTSQVPGLLLQESDEKLWNYPMEEQPQSCQSFVNKRCNILAGKSLGGTSNLNAMLYVRGSPKDYDDWKAAGNEGWDYKNVLKYFKKSEDNGYFSNDTVHHGTGGYWKINNYDSNELISDTINEAAKNLGYDIIDDINGEWKLGFGKAQGNIYKGRRFGTFEAFLNPVIDRPNLFIAKNTYVNKVIIDPKTKQTNGIEVQVKGKVLKIPVKMEVILTAGAINTPKILLLSGIGPQEDLDELNIQLIKDLPVGKNLQDHIQLSNIFVKFEEFEDDTLIKNLTPNEIMDNIYDYFIHRKGILSKLGVINHMGLINTKRDSDQADIQLHQSAYTRGSLSIITRTSFNSLNNELSKTIVNINNKYPLLQLIISSLEGRSKGQVKLRSKDPMDSPIIISNYLTDEEEVETLLRGIKVYISIFNTTTFTKYKPEIVNKRFAYCKEFEYLSDDYWRCVIREAATTSYHFVGTAKMGCKLDRTAVVDSRLNVMGVEGLRVMDASIMPQIIRGNTNAPVVMIAEKGCDMVKQDWSVLV